MDMLPTTDSETNQLSPPKLTNSKNVPIIQEFFSYTKEMLNAEILILCKWVFWLGCMHHIERKRSVCRKYES